MARLPIRIGVIVLCLFGNILAISVSVADYGAIPNDASADSCAAFARTVETARTSNASSIIIPNGTYHFYWHACTKVSMYVSNTVETPLLPRSIGLYLRGLSDIVIEGKDSLLLFHGQMTPIVVIACRNITVRRLAIDFPHPSVIEGVVTAVRKGSFDLRVHVANNVSVRSAGGVVFGSYGEGWQLDGVNGLLPSNQSDHRGETLVQEWDPVEDVTWRRSNPLSGGATVTLLAGSLLRITTPAASPFSGGAPLLGHSLWFRDGGRANAGMVTQRSTDVAYVDLSLHFLGGFGVVTQLTKNIELTNVSIASYPHSGRKCACAADLLHFSSCGGLINITGGRFVGAQDDGVNVHGVHLQIVEQPSPTSIVLQFAHTQTYGFQSFFAGDVVQFTRADSLEGFGRGVVISAVLRNATGCVADPTVMLPCQQLVTLAEPLHGARLGVDVVENLAFVPNVSISNAYFGRIPTRGMLLTTRGRVRIVNNTVHTPNAPTFLIADDAVSWYESGPVLDVHYESNIVLRNTSRIGARLNPAWSIAPTNTRNATVHQNVRIVRNQVYLPSSAAAESSRAVLVEAKALHCLYIEGNAIHSSKKPALLITTSNCSGVVARNNTVIE